MKRTVTEEEEEEEEEEEATEEDSLNLLFQVRKWNWKSVRIVRHERVRE